MQHDRRTVLVAGTALLALLAVAAVAGLGTVGADSPADSPADRTITVSATGTADAAPDKAVVDVAAVAEGEEPAAVRDDLAADAEQLRTALDDLGVEYETSRYALDRQHPRQLEERDRPAYRGVHAFTVTLDDPDRIGAVVDAAADAGSEVDGVRLTLSDERRTELRDAAIEDAMDDAHRQADTIAVAGDLRVTDTAAVDASQDRFSPVRYDAELAAAGVDSGGTTIDVGDVSVAYNVGVTYNATTA